MLWHCGHLRSQAYEVLKHLAENNGRLVSKNSLIETVWRERAVTDDALVQCLMEVRHALGEKGKRYVDNLDLAFFGAPDEPCFQWSACHNSPFATGRK